MFGSRDFLKRLGDYVSVKTGKLDANASVEGGRYPFFTCAEKTLSIDTYAFDCNAVLLAGNGEFCVKHYDGKFNAYQRTYVIESKDESILSTKYLYAWLKDYANILKANAIGGVIKYIKLGDIINAQINLPSQDRQLEYVKIYEQADKSKFSGLKSQFIEMFGGNDYPLTMIKSIADISTGGTPSKSHPEYWNGDRPWVTAEDMKNKYVYDSCEKITAAGYAMCKIVPIDTLLYVCRGSIGVMAINKIECATNQSICRAKCHDNVCNVEFLYYALMYQRDNIKKMGTGTSFKSLNQTSFSELKIELPPYEKQMEFVAIAQQADKSKQIAFSRAS